VKKVLSIIIIGVIIGFGINYLFSIKYKYEGLKILDIKVQGAFNTDKNDILDVIPFSKGEIFRAFKLSEAIKNIYKTGNYDDVKAEIVKKDNGIIIIFKVKERYKISEIEFVGNDEISRSDLEESIKNIIAVGNVLDETKIQDAVSAILSKYEDEDMFDADVKVEERVEKDNKVKVIFKIKEGDEVKVKSIKILGNKVFNVKKIVGLMDTHIDDWLHSGVFNKDTYEKDKDNIIKFYKKNGYINARIVWDKLQYRIEGKKRKKKKIVYITIKLYEGKQYKFGGYTITNNRLFSKKEIMSKLKLKKGAIFNETQFEQDIQAIQGMYGARGYIFARVMPEESIDKEKRLIKYKINIYEGEIAHIESIIIKGNTKTKDYVILRELLVKEGEIFNAKKIQRSQQKIYNLGFFKNVNIDVRPGSAEGLMALIIEVEEQSTGMITLGAVYGTVDGFGGYEEVSENNLMGRGIRINERIEVQFNKQEYRAGITYPWIFGTPMNFSFSIFYRHYSDLKTPELTTGTNYHYKKQEWGVNTGLTRRISDKVNISGFYGIELYKYYSHDRGESADLSIREKVGHGDYIKSYLTLKYDYDSRDNIFNPTTGFHFNQTWQLTGGFLGGDDRYMKFITDMSKYYPLIWKFVFVTHFNYGVITSPFGGKDLLINADDRLYLGSVETIRGWEYTDRDWATGGLSRIYSNLEIRFPISERLLWMVFYGDAGNMWQSTTGANFDYTEYAYSTGFGFRVQIPMFPIRLYFSKTFEFRDNKLYLYDKGIMGWKFNISVGGLF